MSRWYKNSNQNGNNTSCQTHITMNTINKNDYKQKDFLFKESRIQVLFFSRDGTKFSFMVVSLMIFLFDI